MLSAPAGIAARSSGAGAAAAAAVIIAAANTASFAAPSAGTTAPAAGSGTAGAAAVASVAVASVAVAFSFSAQDWRVRRLPLRRLTLFLFIVILGGGRGWGERGEFRCRNARACLGIFEGATYIIALGLTLGGGWNGRAGSLTCYPSGGQQLKRAFCIIRPIRRLQQLCPRALNCYRRSVPKDTVK